MARSFLAWSALLLGTVPLLIHCSNAPAVSQDASDATTVPSSSPDPGTVYVDETDDAAPRSDAQAPMDQADGSADLDAGRTITIPRVTNGDTTTLTLVSPESCVLRGDILFKCALPMQTLEAPKPMPAGNVRTVVTPRWEGNCSTHYPLALVVEGPGVAPASLSFFAKRPAVLVRDNAGALESLVVRDDSPWTGAPLFDPSCRVYLDVRFNVSAEGGDAEADAVPTVTAPSRAP